MISKSILQKIFTEISTQEEKKYFLIHQERYKVTLNEIEQISENKKLTILDIGCYPYHIGKALELMGHTIYGISSFHEPIKKNNVKIINIEKNKFPFVDNMFDLVLFNEVIEHLPQTPVIPLQEIHRVLKKNGSLMITTPNITRSINRIKILCGKSIMYSLDTYFENNGEGNNIYHRHNREYTLQEIVYMLEKCSFKISKKKLIISYTPFREKIEKQSWWLIAVKYLNYFLMQGIPSFKDTIFVLAEK